MPVYKLILPVVSFSSHRPVPGIRAEMKPIFVETRDPERRPETLLTDDGLTPPSAGTPFG